MRIGPKQLRFSPDQSDRSEPPVSLRTKMIRASGILLLAAIALLTGAAQSGQQSPPVTPSQPNLLPDANQSPVANAQSQPEAVKTTPQGSDALPDPKKQQLSLESAQLLTLAISLKAEVDKTNKDTLSLNVIRKADEIEKLAHSVRDKMRVSVGAN